MTRHAQRFAALLRHGAAREAERRGPGRYRATVLSTSPLKLDLHGSDLMLDADDVTVGRSVVESGGINAGDVVVLVEVDENDYVAVDVEPDGEGE